MSRAYGWRASCLAGGVTAVGVGSGAWFGSVFIYVDTRLDWSASICCRRRHSANSLSALLGLLGLFGAKIR